MSILDSIVVSIPACHAGDPGSIPGREDFLHIVHSLDAFPNLIKVYICVAILKAFIFLFNAQSRLLRVTENHQKESVGVEVAWMWRICVYQNERDHLKSR